jgi:hypothetical protein
MRFGSLLIGGAVAVTGFIGFALLAAVEGTGSSLEVLVSCAPTLPPDEKDDEKDEDSESDEQSSTQSLSIIKHQI